MQLSKTQFNATYNDATNGRFPTNTTQEIGSDDLRLQAEDLKDSTFFLTDNAYNGAKGTKLGASTITALKAVVTTSIETGVLVAFRDTGNGNVLRVYELVSGTDAESSPDVVRPDDYAATTNEKVWKLASNFTYDSKVVTAAGTDTYTAAVDPAISSYVTGAHYFIQFTNANTGASTLNLNSLGAKSIVKNGSAALAVSDINAGQVYELLYDGTNLQILGRVGGGGGGGITNTAANNEIMKSDGTNAIGSGLHAVSSKLGVGTATPHADIQTVSGSGRKIVWFEVADNDHQIAGITKGTFLTGYHVPSTDDDHIFYAGTSTTTSDELMRIKGNGNVIVPEFMAIGEDGTLVSRLTIREDQIVANRFIELLHGTTSKHLTYFVEATTTDATTTTIQQAAALDNTSFFVKAVIIAMSSTGTTTNGYEINAVLKKVSGSLTLIGTTTISNIEQAGAWAAEITGSSGNIVVNVTGAAATTIKWTCKTDVTMVTQ